MSCESECLGGLNSCYHPCPMYSTFGLWCVHSQVVGHRQVETRACEPVAYSVLVLVQRRLDLLETPTTA